MPLSIGKLIDCLKTATVTQPIFFDVLLAQQQTLDIPVTSDHAVILYVYAGKLRVDANNREKRQVGLIGYSIEWGIVRISTTKMFVSGRFSLRESVVQTGPLAKNTKAEIRQAYRRTRSHRCPPHIARQIRS